LVLIVLSVALVRRTTHRTSLAGDDDDEIVTKEALPALKGTMSQDLRVVQATRTLPQRSRVPRVGKVLLRCVLGT